MKKYYNLLGLHIDEVKQYFDERNVAYTIKSIEGKKDKDKLVVPRVIKISEIGDSVELIITYFSDSLI
ncbi:MULTISPECIES: hypothetical protein [unclassified Clostridioides]|uniref:hypothetical protein n=1 Tax=unclassified Clostridioides TaxID=2635829 RepID=UPI001D121025|nr:hypothetical protein [Clostridioides sp. ZZV15-6388]MCC0643451.1 hypothetical protein [Clostridioides sp. ZZV14-6150]MCC0658721.1 hypothetical protein [Clostridioides sp. ZZV14-6154]MCC0665736.1 hypothetical protein [Clostridioides sp. ZZV15-6597]MCC0668817.1 hypothetical protein [Clostridioides sp. ZZV14-6153]MCC0720442.1 hypothetical protein [Clostridioides sp. ZZV14-6105]MCC0721716.1 hypothetical protein [Clostridioides sp. ZZV14-6104]MCC0725100.1 hypothetical protein [Clostridioides s